MYAKEVIHGQDFFDNLYHDCTKPSRNREEESNNLQSMFDPHRLPRLIKLYVKEVIHEQDFFDILYNDCNKPI